MDIVLVDSWSHDSIENQSNGKDIVKLPVKVKSVTETCRLCGEKKENCIPIFENKLSVAEKISRCLPIMVLANDNLPLHVCKRCLAYLNISYKLIVNSLKTDAYLRKKLDENGLNQQNEKVNFAQITSTPKTKEVKVIPMKKLKKLAIHGPVTCEFCNVTFEDVIEFDEHFESNHILKWKCNFCDGSFPTSDELITHKAMLHAGNIIICKSCVDEETAQKKKHKKVKIEEDSWSSGGEHEEKFYIPAELSELSLNLPDTSNSSNLKTSFKSVTSVSFNNELSQSTSGTLNMSNSEQVQNTQKSNMLPASFLVSPELTSRFLNNSDNLAPQLVFTSPDEIPQLILPPTSDPLMTSPIEPEAEISNSSSVSKLIKSVRFSINEKMQEMRVEETNKVFFNCDVCHLQVDDKKLLELHQKIHRPKPMVCVLCKHESPTIYDLYLHKRNVHNLYSKVNLKYVCDKCGKFFSNSWQWETHKTRRCRNREGSNKCKYCEASFSTSHKLKRHLRKHKQEMFSDPSVKIFKCVSCPKIFVDEEFYQKHRNVHDPECWNNFKCTVCDRSFRDNVRLKEHMKSIHEGVKPHMCDVCSKTFHRLSNMKVHRALHFGHNCSHCDKVFEKVRQLVDHIQQDHGLEPPASLIAKKGYVSGTYICKYCGRSLATYQSLLDHEHIHTGEKPYPCHICDKSFRSYTARWSHMQRHKKGNFICEQCGKVFGFKQNLMTHVQIHVSMDERKHQCPTCNKKFLRKAHLNVHMRIHEGIRPYTCDICNFSFTQIGDMRRHRARHANGEVRKRQPRVKVENVKWISETSNEDTN